jgi:hypothetical protein
MEENEFLGESDRRRFLKRAGVVAGATVWATPVIQSVASPAFATGSPSGDCPPEKLIRFKFDVDGVKFDSGDAGGEAGACLADVDGYSTAGRSFPNGSGYTSCYVNGSCRVCVTISISGDKKQATVTVTGGTIKDVDIKGGSTRSPNGHCTDGDPMGDGSTSVINVPPGGAAISFVGGVVCPSC